ncbi:MAG: ABC transporter permease [Alphaproteobacteria bacterium]|nr:ABC transporter permease [Alphaproteobacteria bacterium]
MSAGAAASGRRHAGVAIASLLVVLVLCFPLIVLVGVSLNAGPRQVFPPEGLSLRWYLNVFDRDGFRRALQFSLALATLSTATALVVGVLAGIAIVRHRFPGRDVLLTALMSPLVVPQVVVGMAFLMALSALRIHSSLLGMFVMHTILVMPYTVRLVVSSLTRFRISLEEAARSLGASPARAFRLVTLPIIRPGMFAAGVFAFVSSFENFTATQFLVWERTTLPIEIYGYVQTENDPTAAAISTMVIIVTAVLTLALNRYIGVDAFARR